MSWTSTFEADLAGWIADRVAALEFSPTGAYPPGTVGIFLAGMPATPDRAVALTAYPLDDHGGLGSDRLMVQIRCRGDQDRRTARALADAVFDVLQGVTHITLPGGAYVVHVGRESSLPMGADANGRHETSCNYAVTVNRPTTHRPD